MKISCFALALVTFSNSLHSLKAFLCDPNLGDDFKNNLDISQWPTLNGSTNRKRDDSIAFFASGDFLCKRGAEMEGKIVVLGDYTVEANGLSNVVNVGQGSQVVPSENQVVMTVGGDLYLGRSVDFFTTDTGSLRVGGQFTTSDGGGFYLPGPTVVNSPLAEIENLDFEILLEDLQLKSAYWATLTSNGVVGRADQWAPVVFTAGDSSALQVFNLGANDLNFNVGTNVIFHSSLADRTILINVGAGGNMVSTLANIASMVDPAGGSNHNFGPTYTANILWNFYAATTVKIGDYKTGNGEFVGTILVPGVNNGVTSTLTLTVPGHSGQVIVNGNVIQDKGGSEWHNYPFDPITPLPEHPDCDTPPVSSPVSSPAKISGDPHIKAWNGEHYDFHGVCDLVMLKNPSFDNGVGMDIQVRTKRTKQWSYISSAVLKIGEETLEVKGDRKGCQYWINSVAGGDLQSLNGFTVTHNQINANTMEFIVYLNGDQRIVLKTFKEMVGVEIFAATETEFGSSLGLMGTFGEGLKLGRDRVLIEDDMQFGQEWQVQASEPMLFHDVEGPQAPVQCEIPQATTLRRRLDESKISIKEAELACSGVASDDFDSCVFDIIATSDIESAGAY